VNKFQLIFDKQKEYFNTNATKSYEWRIEQLDRMAKMLNENTGIEPGCIVQSASGRKADFSSL
jgi:hypothetical protein